MLEYLSAKNASRRHLAPAPRGQGTSVLLKQHAEEEHENKENSFLCDSDRHPRCGLGPHYDEREHGAEINTYAPTGPAILRGDFMANPILIVAFSKCSTAGLPKTLTSGISSFLILRKKP
jgi:hypothetical protein